MKHRLFILVLLFPLLTQAQRAIPELWGVRVHDEAGVLSQAVVQQLEQDLKIFEDSTTNQMAILIIPSLDGEVLEDYALKVATAWKLGQQGRDNGILLLIAINDRKMRIEVGYGLEGVLPDALCSQIIRNEMAPNFRRGDYDAGVSSAVRAINEAIKGEYSVEDFSGATGEDSAELTWKEKALMGLFVMGILGIFTLTGIFTRGAAGWVMYFFLIPFYAIFPGAIFGWNAGLVILLIYLPGFIIMKLLANKFGWGKNWNQGGRNGGGWSSGSGWIGGGGGWSSGGGGGFSGGGGSFGGGGSSGSW
jgi:uncharacterized protein